jgi:hypothetical protein
VLPDRLDQAAVHSLSRRGRQRDHPDWVIVSAFTNETDTGRLIPAANGDRITPGGLGHSRA